MLCDMYLPTLQIHHLKPLIFIQFPVVHFKCGQVHIMEKLNVTDNIFSSLLCTIMAISCDYSGFITKFHCSHITFLNSDDF